MIDKLDAALGFQREALNLRVQRQEVLAANIAHADTPNYKARDFDFARALQTRTSGMDAAKAEQAATLYRVPVMPSLDGNTVEMSTEQTAFAENALGYSATLTFIRGRVETVTRALQGE